VAGLHRTRNAKGRYEVSHGMSKTPIHNLWWGMVQRCTDKSRPAYRGYGGRGITVCERWMTFENFYEDMGDKPAGKSLDRIDNDLGYSKDNCRWATQKEQTNNMRANRHFTIQGETKTLSQWVELSSVKPSTVRQRFYVLKWPIERALGMDGGVS